MTNDEFFRQRLTNSFVIRQKVTNAFRHSSKDDECVSSFIKRFVTWWKTERGWDRCSSLSEQEVSFLLDRKSVPLGWGDRFRGIGGIASASFSAEVEAFFSREWSREFSTNGDANLLQTATRILGRWRCELPRTVTRIFCERLREFSASNDSSFGPISAQIFRGQWREFSDDVEAFFSKRRCEFSGNGDANLLQTVTRILG